MRALMRLIPVAAAIACVGCTSPATDPAPTTPVGTTVPVPARTAPDATDTPGREVDKAALLSAVAKAQRDARTAARLEVLGPDKSRKGTGKAALDFAPGAPTMYVEATQSGGIELFIDGDTAYVKAGQLTNQKWLRSPLAKAPAAVRQVQASYDYAALAPQVDRAVYRGTETMAGSEARHYTLSGADNLTQELWIDESNRPVRSERATQEGIVVSTFGSFGQPVSLPSPSPSEVVDLPG